MQGYPKVKAVIPYEGLELKVTFDNGITKYYNVEQLFERFPDYELLKNRDIFDLAHVDCGGYAIAFSDELDITECELWENGTVK